MHARFYSPTTGRFLSPDPSLDIDHAMSHPQAWNRYSYVENNPIGKIDPNGRDAWDVINGFSNAFVNDLGLTVRRDGGNSDYQRGQVGGDQAGVVSGFVIAGAFAGAEGTFTVATAGAGAVAVPVAAVGVGYGLAVSANSGLHLKSDVQANQAQGKAGEQKVIKALEAQGNDVTPQVRKNTPFGPRVIDAEVSKNGKVLGGVEVKTGNSAYNASQRAKDAWLRNTLDYIVNVIRLAK